MPAHWLDLYGPGRYVWRESKSSSGKVLYRRLGIVENLFDSDGTYFEGRADLHQDIRIEVRTRLSAIELRKRIVLAWTLMRGYHVLMACKSCHLQDIDDMHASEQWTDKCFAFVQPGGMDQAISEARSQVCFVEDTYPDVDFAEFYHHIKNTGRALDPSKGLAKLYVMPPVTTQQGTLELRFVLILAHQITDGLTSFRWGNHLPELLNYSVDKMYDEIEKLSSSQRQTKLLLPPAQEALYPARSKTHVRARWQWAVTRILRYVKKAAPTAFPNPLRRDKILSEAERLPLLFSKVLDYSRVPPLGAGWVGTDLSKRASSNLTRLCKQGGFSVGSGCFVLVALVMMQLEEKRNPDIKSELRLPFVGSFPINPRPFLTEATTGKEDSCMLAFSEGVALPFLPSDLDFVGRFKLLGKLAHKQLRQYQKRKRSTHEQVLLGSRSPDQLLPALFLSTMERMEDRALPSHKAHLNPQGAYQAQSSAISTFATCGISSVGDVSGLLSTGKHDVGAELGDRDLIADMRGMGSVVRPRDGEFLVGAVSKNGVVSFGSAFDANAIDPDRAERWKQLMESVLDKEMNLENSGPKAKIDVVASTDVTPVVSPARTSKL